MKSEAQQIEELEDQVFKLSQLNSNLVEEIKDLKDSLRIAKMKIRHDPISNKVKDL